MQPMAASSMPLEFVPGRDALVGAAATATGVAVFDAERGEHVLTTMAVPVRMTLEAVCACLCFVSGTSCSLC
jgi:hypothetical protein